MNYVMFSKNSLIFLLLQLCILLPLTSMELQPSPSESCELSEDDQSESPFCNLPDPALDRIVQHLGTWKQINKLGRCCKFLDRRLTIPRKPIVINRWSKRRKNQAPEDFLSQIRHLIYRIVKKPSNNPITINIKANNLEQDRKALAHFLKQCAEESIVTYITSLELNSNKLTSIPKEIPNLTHLKELEIGENPIGYPNSLVGITTLSNLEKLQISNIGLQQLPEQMEELKKLKRLDISDNFLNDDLFKIILALNNLEEIKLSINNFSFKSMIINMSQHPCIKTIYASRLHKPAIDLEKIKFTSPEATVYF